MNQLKPSPPGYNFTVADLQRARIAPEHIDRIIMQAQQGNIDVLPLLAAIFKGQVKLNSNYNSLGYALPIWSQIQLFGENNLRNYLMVQNVGTGDLMLVFEAGSQTVEDYSAAADQQQLTNKQTRALRIVSGGYFEPLVPPKNPMTIFTLSTGTNGVAIEGIYT